MRDRNPCVAHRLAVAVALVSAAACSRPAGPEFLDLADVAVKGAKRDGTLVLTGNAVFNNPNGFGVHVTGLELDVIVDEREAAKVRQVLSTQVAANSEFSLPVEIEIPIKKVFEDLGDLLGGLLSGDRQSVSLLVDGRILVEAVGIELAVPFRHEEQHEIDL